jgi:hypothetical protein
MELTTKRLRIRGYRIGEVVDRGLLYKQDILILYLLFTKEVHGDLLTRAADVGLRDRELF